MGCSGCMQLQGYGLLIDEQSAHLEASPLVAMQQLVQGAGSLPVLSCTLPALQQLSHPDGHIRCQRLAELPATVTDDDADCR